LSNISYPKNKLEIILLLEEKDAPTINALKNIKLPHFFKTVIVPASVPQTKPKACNYGLLHAKGKYITIYDAEDFPDMLQLKKVVNKFRELDRKYICIQSKLNYYNRNETYLSKLFSIEYYHWFELMLAALYKLDWIIPLGGTSNHFIREKLMEVGGWDPYNVTEDAELGIRISILGYKTYLLNSVTLEESPIDIKTWITQRTRWIKGYLTTYINLFKKLNNFKHNLNLRKIIGLHLFVGFSNLSFFLVPVMLLTTILEITDYINIEISTFTSNMSIFIFCYGIFLNISISSIVIVKNKWFNMSSSVLLFPFYWVLHGIAAYRALYQLINQNNQWEKTTHGLTRIKFIDNV
jgi:hypothetical protein